jgi:hypothetical protein
VDAYGTGDERPGSEAGGGARRESGPEERQQSMCFVNLSQFLCMLKEQLEVRSFRRIARPGGDNVR